MGVVKGGVFDPGTGHDPCHLRLPHPLREPHAARGAAKTGLAVVAHARDLRHGVALWNGAQQRLVVAAAHDLDLARRVHAGKPVKKLRTVFLEPVKERTGEMQHGADGGKAFEHVQKRLVGQIIGLFEDESEVSHRLVGMAAENEADAPLRRTLSRWCVFRTKGAHPACPLLLRMMSSFKSRAVWTPISFSRWFSAATSMMMATLRPGRTGMRI